MRNTQFLDLFFSQPAKRVWQAVFLFIFLFLLFNQVILVHAQPALNQGLGQFQNETQLSNVELTTVVGRIVRYVLGFLGLIAVIILIIGGFKWMTSGGNEEKIEKAKKLMLAGLIGLLIIVLAYAAASFIINLLSRLIGAGAGGGGCSIGQVNGCYRCLGPAPGHWVFDASLLGCTLPPDAFSIKKIVTTHGQGGYHQDVYLCSGVQPIFNHWVNSSKIDELSQNNKLRIIDGQNNIFNGTWQAAGNTVVFKHPNLFSPNTGYRAILPKEIEDTASKQLQRCQADGGCAFDSGLQSYVWNFTTGVNTDNTKPFIVDTYPISKLNDPAYPDRNVSRRPLIQVNFSEPIDATTVIDKNGELLADNIWVAEIDARGGQIKPPPIPASSWTVEVGEKGFSLYLKDGVFLDAFAWYRLHIGNIEDLCSNVMEPNNVEWEFQTNDRMPGVESYYPIGQRVCPDTNLAIIFNTQMYENKVKIQVLKNNSVVLQAEMKPSEVGQPYSVNGLGGRFFVEDNNDNPVDNHFRVFKFDPTNDLSENTQYKVKVTTDLVININGDKLEQEWNFTTATAATCLCSPWISRLDPAQGPLGQCVTVYGECFTGTAHQPAVPEKIDFIFNNIPIPSTIGSYGSNFLTTVVPTQGDPQDDRPDARITIKYGPPNNDELVSNLSEFYVNQPGSWNGPCLWSIIPSSGKAGETKVSLSGVRFGTGQNGDAVKFYNQQLVADCPGQACTWTDTKISGALVPAAAKTGDIVVINSSGTSNPVNFKVIEESGRPGDRCLYENVCPTGVNQCQEPQTYFCLVNQTDCRCCCRVNPNSCQNGLNCLANQGKCTGTERGLCCGCQSDEQCGLGLGCGILDPQRCCYPNPIVESKNPDDNATNVCKNTGVQVIFDQKMDPASLSSTNIKFERCTDQQCANETQPVSFDLVVNQYQDKTGFTLYPRNCLLDSNTWYRVTVLGKLSGGKMGDGVRSNKGVSMLGQEQWVFQTNDTLCVVDRVALVPPNETTIEVGQKQPYSATAFQNNNPVCVPSFDWASSNVSVAIVAPASGRETLATGLSKGQTTISGGVWVENGGGEKVFIKGESLLDVKLTSLKIDESSTCNPSQQKYPSPNPQPNNQQACPNIKISARFNKKVDDSTVNTNTIKVLQKEGGGKVVAKSIEVIADGQTEKFVFEPLNDLLPDTTYQATVVSGDQGVLGEDGSTLAQDYVWEFKTLSGASCPIQAVEVDPSSDVVIKNPSGSAQQVDYLASALAQDCQMLAGSYAWQWSSSQPDVATVSSAEPPSGHALATIGNLGETDISAATSNKSNSGHLAVTAVPIIEDKSPSDGATNVCRNAIVSVQFNEEMDVTTTTTSTSVFLEEFVPNTIPIPPAPTSGFLKNLVFKFEQGLIKTTRAQSPPPGYWTKVAGQIRNYKIPAGSLFKTLVTFTPSQALPANTQLRMTIKGGESGVMSKYEIPMTADVAWTFTTGSDICQIASVKINPSSYQFTKANDSKDFLASVFARDNQQIHRLPGVYDWNWTWKSSDTNIVTVTGDNNEISKGTVIDKNKNGNATVTATARDSNNKDFLASAAIQVFICENPWWSYQSEFYNFALTYCRDGSPLLPQLSTPPASGGTSGDLKLHWLFGVPGTSDIIGLMVYDNFDHLTPLDWYRTKVTNPGSPSTLTIDGYQAIKDGRTVYVGAANADIGQPSNPKPTPDLYSNIFLLSYNNEATPSTIQIVNQLIKYWRFNTNLADQTSKDELTRDLQRLYHFNQMSQILEQYKSQSAGKDYPQLKAGTYLSGLTTSRWPSWQQTLSQALGQPLPIDSLNTFTSRVCSGGYSCCADCPQNDSQCQGTCYNPDPSQKKYECVSGSHVYQYLYHPANVDHNHPSGYSLFANFEYSQPDLWQHGCAGYNSQAKCQQHIWCVWSGGCQPKALNYSSNPCVGLGLSTCACFNAEYNPTDYYQIGHHAEK